MGSEFGNTPKIWARDDRTPFEKALAYFGARLTFDKRLGCYRLDEKPVRIQDPIARAKSRP